MATHRLIDHRHQDPIAHEARRVDAWHRRLADDFAELPGAAGQRPGLRCTKPVTKKALRPKDIRWRHEIRNFTIRNRDSRWLFFLNFLLWVKELVNSDCRSGFLVKNCIYSQLDMSRIPKIGPKIRNSQTLAQKSAISYHMSPP